MLRPGLLPKTIVDVGTGSGCIAVSLAKFIANAEITATDISPVALEISRQNAILNKVSERIKFVCADLFKDYRLRIQDYDMIVSNPPYIPGAEIAGLQPEVRREPHVALDGGRDGLDFYRRIIARAPHYLRKGGLLIMEMGFQQREAIENIFREPGIFEVTEVVKDYNNIDRVIVARV